MPFHRWAFSDGTIWAEFYRSAGGVLLRFPTLADFEISDDGQHVTCALAPNVPETTAEHLYLNQVQPLALSKLGKLVFHASAVELNGGAIAFLAETGRGKSTLAASFATNGYRFLTDDGLVLEPEEQGYAVIPSHPSIRLWNDSHQRLLAPDTNKAAPLHYTSKSRFLAGSLLAHCDQPRLLRAAYFLGNGTANEITFRRLTPAESLLAWLKHAFLLDVEDRTLIRSHFDGTAKLANDLVCHHLDYPRCYDVLDSVRQAIVRHANSESVLV
jgi:hypothetical protein